MAITVVANTPATAAAFNNLVPTYYRQASDQALATTTYTDHNTFTAIAIAANTTWDVEFCLASTQADPANDIKVRLESTGTVALDSYRFISAPGVLLPQPVAGGATVTATTPVEVAGHYQARAMTDSVSGGSSTSASVLALWREKFILVGGASGGTFGVEWGQNIATSGSTTVKAGSFMILRRLV